MQVAGPVPTGPQFSTNIASRGRGSVLTKAPDVNCDPDRVGTMPTFGRLGYLRCDVIMEAVPGLRVAGRNECRRLGSCAAASPRFDVQPERAAGLSGDPAFWMLAETPATNVMGSNPTFALSVLQNQTACWRRLAARCIVIASIIGLAYAIGDVCRPRGLSVERDLVGLCTRRTPPDRSASGGRPARDPVPLPSSFAVLALAAPPSLAYASAVGRPRLCPHSLTFR